MTFKSNELWARMQTSPSLLIAFNPLLNIIPSMTKNNNVVWHHATIKGADREKLNGHKSVALWFTGISAPYESPENPELHLQTGEMSLKECVDIVVKHLLNKKIVSENAVFEV